MRQVSASARNPAPAGGSGMSHRNARWWMPRVSGKPKKLSRTCSRERGAMRALVKSHCASRARAACRSRVERSPAGAGKADSRAATAACGAARRSVDLRILACRSRHAARPARLSTVINSTPSMSSIRRDSRFADDPCQLRLRPCTLQRPDHRDDVARVAERRESQYADSERRSVERQLHGEYTVSGRWPLGSEVKHSVIEGGAMLYDASRARNLTAAWFDPRYWSSRGESDGTAQGRGTTHFVRSRDRRLVLRHYHRGGLVSLLSSDRYIWSGEEQTRPFSEWAITYRLHRAGLPVPAPIAARYVRRGRTYRGDIITERLTTVGLARRVPRPGSALHRRLDLDRALHPALSRLRCLSRRSQRTQRAAQRGDRLPDRLRPLPAPAGRSVARRQSRAACADHWRRSPTDCRRTASARLTGMHCSTGIASRPRPASRRPADHDPPCAVSSLASRER